MADDHGISEEGQRFSPNMSKISFLEGRMTSGAHPSPEAGLADRGGASSVHLIAVVESRCRADVASELVVQI